jgi:hypothetical protein
MTTTSQSRASHLSAESETYIVSSTQPQEEILKALQALEPSLRQKKLVVRLSGKQFIIARRQLVTNPFARSLFGVVNESSTGSVIDYTFSVRPAVKILFSLWFALMSVVLITGLSTIITNGLSGYRVELCLLAVTFLASALGFRQPLLVPEQKQRT